MNIKYNAYIKDDAVENNLRRLVNQIYKLLPTREEYGEWEKPLTTIIEELAGMHNLLLDHHQLLFSLLCKLEGLFMLAQDEDFFIFRKTIFECLALVSELISTCH